MEVCIEDKECGFDDEVPEELAMASFELTLSSVLSVAGSQCMRLIGRISGKEVSFE